MSAEPRSALVVLHPGTPGDQTQRAGEVPPAEDVVGQVTDWFAQRGFEVGAFVGISFSISGTSDLFGAVLGADPDAQHSSADLPMERLSDEIAPLVAAVTTTPPPDFGPGNP